jgi:hypothetical protein
MDELGASQPANRRSVSFFSDCFASGALLRGQILLRASGLRPGPQFHPGRSLLDGVKGTPDQGARARKVPRRLKKAASGKGRQGREAFSVLVVWGISGRLNNTRQVPAARAFVSNQTGLMEERGDACDLSHLCCFASRTQKGSSGALTRHRLLHFRCVCTLLIFQRSYSDIGCERLRASGHAREGGGKRGPRPAS